MSSATSPRSLWHTIIATCFLLAGCSLPLNATGWHTDGTQIVNPSGASFVASAVNWYGDGLWAQDYTFILKEINGFNANRLPCSNQMWETDPVPSNHIYHRDKVLGASGST